MSLNAKTNSCHSHDNNMNICSCNSRDASFASAPSSSSCCPLPARTLKFCKRQLAVIKANIVCHNLPFIVVVDVLVFCGMARVA